MAERRFTITAFTAIGDGRYRARVNGEPVAMLNRLGGWIASNTGKELIGDVVIELNKRVKSARRQEANADG